MAVKALDIKTVQIVAPQVVSDNAELVGSKGSTPISVDVRGFGFMAIKVMFGAMDIAMATMKLYYSDDNSTFTSLAAGNYATSPATLPASTADNLIFAWYVNLVKYPYRYWQVELISGNGAVGTYVAVWADLSRPSISPSTAALRGNSQELIV